MFIGHFPYVQQPEANTITLKSWGKPFIAGFLMRIWYFLDCPIFWNLKHHPYGGFPSHRGTPVIIHLLRWIFHGFSMKTIQRVWGNLQIQRAHRLLRMESMCQSQDCYGWHLGDWISMDILCVFFTMEKGWKMIGKSLKMMENDWKPPCLTVKQPKNAECSVAMLNFQNNKLHPTISRCSALSNLLIWAIRQPPRPLLRSQPSFLAWWNMDERSGNLNSATQQVLERWKPTKTSQDSGVWRSWGSWLLHFLGLLGMWDIHHMYLLLLGSIVARQHPSGLGNQHLSGPIVGDDSPPRAR